MPAAFAEGNRIGIAADGNGVITGSGINGAVVSDFDGIVAAAADKGGFAAVVA